MLLPPLFGEVREAFGVSYVEIGFALTAFNAGSEAKVTAGSNCSEPSCRQARAQPPRLNRRPSTCVHGTFRLDSRVRAVTSVWSATVRSRSMNTDMSTGITSNVSPQGPQAGNITMLNSARKPDAICAIGEIRITTGDVLDRGAISAF